MIIVGGNEALANRKPRQFSNASGFYRPYFDHIPNHPQAYMIEHPEWCTIPAHYHEIDEFQIMFEGEGIWSERHIRALSFKYNSAWLYNFPVTAKAGGMKFMSMRRNWDSNGKFLPERQADYDAGKPDDAEEFQYIGKEIPLHPNGLAAKQFRIPRGQSVPMRFTKPGGSTYLFVLDGTIMYEGTEYELHSLFYLEPEDPPMVISTTVGARVAFMQFPIQP